VFRLKAEGDEGKTGGWLSAVKGVAAGLKTDLEDDRPDHAAHSSGHPYVGAPAGKLDKTPPETKHDATPPPPRS
jgi:hypothetical protein